MLFRRYGAGILIGLLVAHAAMAQGVKLTEAELQDRCVRNELVMEFDGKMTIQQDGKEVSFPHKAQARHVFSERYLDVTGARVDRAARLYDTAERTVRFDNDQPHTIQMRPARRFLAAQRVKDIVVGYSPAGRLTRDEADLTEHFDTLALPALLPNKTLNGGESWQVSNKTAIATLCGLEVLSGHNVEGTLTEVKNGIAHLKLVGKVDGIDKGAQVTLLVNSKLEFDVSAQTITMVEWTQEEKREQGPVSPKLSADVKIRLKRTPIDQPEELSNNAIVPIRAHETPPANRVNIDHKDAKGRFTLQYPRDWYVTSPDDHPQLVMRLMERGEFLAQVTVSPWKKTDLKDVMSLEAFEKLMAESPGWKLQTQQESKELKDLPKSQHTAYRVVASGELDEVKTWQYFYLIVGQQGDHCIVTFSVVPQHVQRLGSRDVELVRDLVLPMDEK